MWGVKQYNLKLDDSIPQTAISLASSLKPDKTTGGLTNKPYKLQKDIKGIGKKDDIVTLTNAGAADIIKADPAALIEYTAPTSGSEDKTRMDVVIKGAVDDPLTKDIDERFGTIIRILPSLSGTDSWHHEKGYVGNTRAAQAYAWGRDTGYKGHFQVNVNELKI